MTVFCTRMGWVALLSDDLSLYASTLPQKTRDAAIRELGRKTPCARAPLGSNALAHHAKDKLERYFERHPVTFDDLAFDDSTATEFRRQVWQLTRAIPYGYTRTYHQLAFDAGRPNAARAIGQCMALNPLPIIIPCHRVVGSHGELRGFGGGLPMKRALLQMEGAL